MYIQHAWDAAVVGLWQVQVGRGEGELLHSRGLDIHERLTNADEHAFDIDII